LLVATGLGELVADRGLPQGEVGVLHTHEHRQRAAMRRHDRRAYTEVSSPSRSAVAVRMVAVTRRRRSRRPLWFSATAAGVLIGMVVVARPLVDGIAESARRPTGRVGRLLYGPAPAGLAPYGRVLDALDLRGDDVLLEIGPGGGNFLARALELAGSAAAIDHSQDMVDATCRRNAAAVAASRLDVRLGDAASLPWDDGSFTAVAMNQVFFWLPDPDRVLAEVHRVLRPGGRLAILGASNRPATRLLVLPYLQGGMRLYDDHELARMLRSAGLTEVDVASRGLVQYARAVRDAAS
jgi:SAM-dependent methyltransferase